MKKAPQKYKNVRTNGFSSKGEFDCYVQLKLRLRAREISDLQTQVWVWLTQTFRCRIDFKFFDRRLNQYIWADFKGAETARWKTIKGLWTEFGPGPLQVYKGRGLRISLTETINTSLKSNF